MKGFMFACIGITSLVIGLSSLMVVSMYDDLYKKVMSCDD